MKRITSETGPCAIVPLWLLDAVGPRALILYVEMCRHELDGTAPTRAQLAVALDCSEDTVDRAIAELVEAKALDSWKEGRRRYFRLLRTSPKVRTVADHPTPEVGKVGTVAGDSPSIDRRFAGCPGNDLVLSLETNNYLEKRTPPSPPRGGVVVVDEAPEVIVFDAWKRSTGHQRAALDTKRRNLIRDRLRDGYQVADLCAAVTGWEFSPHHRGENDRQTVYNDLSLLLRDAEHVDRFLLYARQRGGGGSGPRPTLSRRQAAFEEFRAMAGLNGHSNGGGR